MLDIILSVIMFIIVAVFDGHLINIHLHEIICETWFCTGTVLCSRPDSLVVG